MKIKQIKLTNIGPYINENIFDFDKIVLVKYDEYIYIIEFNKSNKVDSYEMNKERNNIEKKRKQYFNNVHQIEFGDAIRDFGFPDHEQTHYRKKDLVVDIGFSIKFAKKENELNYNFHIIYQYENEDIVFKNVCILKMPYNFI